MRKPCFPHPALLTPASCLPRAPSRHRLLPLAGIEALAAAPSVLSACKSMQNFRDLAGVASTTAQIKPGLVLRSATPAEADKADVDRLLRAFPSLRVLDLRSEEDAVKDDGQRLLAERTRHVEMLPKATGQKRLSRHVLTDRLHLTLPLLPFRIMRALPVPGVRAAGGFVVDRGVRRFLETIELTDVYWWILRERGDALRGVLSDLSEAGKAKVPTLIHCAHGKDRTGVVCAVVLHVCGADVEAIASDYALSDEWGCSPKGQDIMLQAMPERFRERIKEWNSPPEDDMEEQPFWWRQFGRWCGAEAVTIVELWRRIDKRYGSMDAYLDSIGFDETNRAELAAALTTEA